MTSSLSSLYFSVQEFCEEEDLKKEFLKAVALDYGRLAIRDIAEKHDLSKSTVQKYKNKLSELDRQNYIIVMNDIYREELNRALLQDRD